MDPLLPHYEEELTRLRRSIASFAARHPETAARLGISGDNCDDPQIERMLQSFALLAARIDSRLNDSYPEFSEAFVRTRYAQYLRPIPACAIARFDIADVFDQLTEPSTLARGMMLTSKTDDYRFRTVYDVTLAPVKILNASYRPITAVPVSALLPPDASTLISITFGVTQPEFHMQALRDRLRVHVDGGAQIVSATMDTILLHTAAAFVEDRGHRWTALQELPVAPVGLQSDEKLIEEDADLPALRLLSEYLSFSKKFDFLDIDLAALARTAGSGDQVTLHLAIRDVHPDSHTGQHLKQLSAENLQLFCTPIVNLLQLSSLPLKRDLQTGDYPILSLNTDVAVGEVWSVEAVRAQTMPGKSSVVQPFVSLMHGSADALAGPYWTLELHNPDVPSEANKPTLALVGLDGKKTDAEIDQLVVDITYTNGDRPRTMAVGAAAGDLFSEENATGARIVLLGTPTEQQHPSREGDALWRLIAQTTPHSIALSSAGLVELKQLLRQFPSPASRLRAPIDALKSLRHRAKKFWWQGEPMPCLVLGLEVTLTVNEYAFSTASLSALISALEPFFAQYVQDTTFIELVVISSNTGVEIRRCGQRQGTIPAL